MSFWDNDVTQSPFLCPVLVIVAPLQTPHIPTLLPKAVVQLYRVVVAKIAVGMMSGSRFWRCVCVCVCVRERQGRPGPLLHTLHSPLQLVMATTVGGISTHCTKGHGEYAHTHRHRHGEYAHTDTESVHTHTDLSFLSQKCMSSFAYPSFSTPYFQPECSINSTTFHP